MASSVYSTIVIRSNNADNIVQRVREAKAASAITPGMLCELTTSGTIQAHSTEGGVAKGRLVALENEFSDHGTGRAIDHAYATNETVRYIHALPGDQLYMLLEDSATITIGDVLESNGAGYMQEESPGTSTLSDGIIGYAANAVTTSGGTARVLVDIAS